MKQLIEEPPETLPLASGDRLPPPPKDHEPPEVRAAKELARRYRLPYIDLLPHEGDSPIDYNLFTEVPVDLMVRHQFVPLRRDARGCTSPWRIQLIWNVWMSWPARCTRE